MCVWQDEATERIDAMVPSQTTTPLNEFSRALEFEQYGPREGADAMVPSQTTTPVNNFFFFITPKPRVE